MSLLKANSVQIGQSSTATQNFTLAVPSSPDGTIKLARGNSGATTADILAFDSGGNVGIGEASPSSKLHIKGTSGTASEIRLTCTTNNAGGKITFYENASASYEIGSGGANNYFYISDIYNNTERLRITNGGQMLIGGAGATWDERLLVYRTSSNVCLGIYANTASFASNLINVQSETASGLTWKIFSGRSSGGGERIIIYGNGNVQNTNASYAGISDIKLKENIADASSQWSDIKALQIRKFSFKEDADHKQMIGLIAQEVELTSPHLVDEIEDKDLNGNALGTTTKAVKYSILYMKAVKALQEAMERIEQLEAKITALEAA